MSAQSSTTPPPSERDPKLTGKTTPHRLVVLASGRGSNLVALQTAIERGNCSAEISLVLSDNPGAGALQHARQLGLPSRCLPFPDAARGQGRHHPARKQWEATLTDAAAAPNPHYVILAGFEWLLSKEFLARFPERVVNLHPSLLPAFPGRGAISAALEAARGAASASNTGCSVHFVDEGVDTGPLIAQAAVDILPGDNEASLQRRVNKAEHRLLPLVIDSLPRLG